MFRRLHTTWAAWASQHTMNHPQLNEVCSVLSGLVRGNLSPSNSDEHEGVPGIGAVHAGIQAGSLYTSAYCRLPPPCMHHAATVYLRLKTHPQGSKLPILSWLSGSQRH